MDTIVAIKGLAAKRFGGEPEAIDENAKIDQLGIDSLGFLEFLFELEDHFAIAIPPDAVANVQTLGELAATIDSLLATKQTAPSEG